MLLMVCENLVSMKGESRLHARKLLGLNFIMQGTKMISFDWNKEKLSNEKQSCCFNVVCTFSPQKSVMHASPPYAAIRFLSFFLYIYFFSFSASLSLFFISEMSFSIHGPFLKKYLPTNHSQHFCDMTFI